MGKNVILINNLVKHYGKFIALNDVTMHIQKGDIYGIVGKNGAGKTTLFKNILGLSEFNSGEIKILNSKNNHELAKARKNIGFLIGQNFYGDLNAYDNLNYYRKIKGIKDKKEIDKVLKIVNLDQEKKLFKNYSMGMKQRLGIANAILGNPEILILDEPINGLDPQGIKEIRSLIKLLNTKYNMTIIISSHILSELELVANRFSIIDQGKIVSEFNKTNLNKHSEVIVLNTNNLANTKNLLEKSFNLNQIEVKDNHLEIYNSKKSVSEITAFLVNNQIAIDGIYQKSESLENIYLKLVESSEYDVKLHQSRH